MGGGGGRKPRGSERAGVGRRLATARQAPEQQTAGDRPRQTSPGPAAGGDRAKASGPATGKPANPSRRTARDTRPEDPHRAVRGRWGKEGSRGRRHGRRRVGWGVGGARSAPSPRPRKPNLEGRGGEVRAGRGTQTTHTHTHTAREETTPPGGGRGRPTPGGRGRMEGAEGRAGGAGRGGAGRQQRRRAAFPRPDPQSSAHAAPTTLLAQLLTPPSPTPGQATHRTQPPGAGRLPGVAGGGGLSLSPLSLPIPRRTGGGEAREPGGARPPHRSRNRPR